jgi:predicted DNA-binding transcriptional regulator YafY
MSRDEDKLIRQLSLLSFLLSRPRPHTAREVQESVEGYAEMSDETFARRFHADRADLDKVGIEIQVLSGAESSDGTEAQLYFLSEEDFRLPGVEFTTPELHALSLALAALDGRFAYARPLRLALTAISRGRRDPLQADLDQLPVALAPDEDARRAGKQLSRLEEAVTRGKTVCFSYPSAEGTPQTRTLDPYSLFLIQGRWYVIGRDHDRRAIRTFRLGRIRGPVHFVTEKARDFSLPRDYDPEEYRARPPWLIGPVQGTATIRVGDDLAWWVKRLEPHVRWLADEDDGGTRFAVPFADEFVLLSWVVGLGSCGELLEPPALRARLRDLLAGVSREHAAAAPAEETAQTLGGGRRRSHQTRPPGPTEDKTGPIAPEHLARAMALLHYLVDEERPALVTWKALKNDLGLTRAEVETDLSLINLVNFGGGTYALTAEAGPDGVHVARDVMADAFAEPARLSPVMARALLLALDLLGDSFALEGLESLASVREKVHELIGTDRSEGSVIVDDVVPPEPEVVDVLNRAIRDHSLVALEYYTTSRQELSKRLVEPYLLFHSPDGWYLEAFCRKAEGQRTFKLERIRAAHSTDAAFVPRPEVDLTRRRTGQAFLPEGVATWATVRFHPRWRAYLEDRGTEYTALPGGDLEGRMPYLDERWMAQEIVRFLGEAVLERPVSARQRIDELARALAARYENPDPASPPLTPSGGAQ